MYAYEANGGRNPKKRSIIDKVASINVVQLTIGH